MAIQNIRGKTDLGESRFTYNCGYRGIHTKIFHKIGHLVVHSWHTQNNSLTGQVSKCLWTVRQQKKCSQGHIIFFFIIFTSNLLFFLERECYF